MTPVAEAGRSAGLIQIRINSRYQGVLEIERRLRKGGYNVGWYLATCLPRGTDLPLSGIASTCN